jgi:hypothetical protein
MFSKNLLNIIWPDVFGKFVFIVKAVKVSHAKYSSPKIKQKSNLATIENQGILNLI